MSPQTFSIKDSLLVQNIQLIDSRLFPFPDADVLVPLSEKDVIIHKVDATVRYPCASYSLRHNNAM